MTIGVPHGRTDGWLTFECTNGCGDVKALPPSAVADATFDPESVVCDDCLRASIPDDVLAMRPVSAPSFARPAGWTDADAVFHAERRIAARLDWERWQERHARNAVKTTADWHLYQRAMLAYAEVIATDTRKVA